MALAIGQRAREVAQEEAEAWVDSADPEWRRKTLATIAESAGQVLPAQAAAVDEGGAEADSGKPTKPRRRRKRKDPKAAERRKEREKRQKIDAEISRE